MTLTALPVGTSVQAAPENETSLYTARRRLRTLDFAKVPAWKKGGVLSAFAAHKNEVTAGYKMK